MKPNAGDVFSNATAYEGYVGRWGRLVAKRFVEWLNVPQESTWLDVGAGTGILTQVILQEAAPQKVIGVDLSPEYIEYARQHVQDARAEFRVNDAGDLTFESPQFDAAVAGLVLNFVPSAEQVVKSMIDAVRVGGMVGAYVWDYGGHMEMMRHFWDAAIRIDPVAKEMEAGQRFAITRSENLHALFESLDLNGVEVIPIDVQTPFSDFDDYWLPFLGAQGSVSRYLRGLNDEGLTALRDQLQKQLPTQDDGTIPLMARAWAVKGTK